MSTFSVEKYPDEPIILVTFNEGYDIFNEHEAFQATMSTMLENLEQPHYQVITFNVEFSLDALIMAANKLARGDDAVWHHDNLKQVVFVTNNDALQLAAEGMSSDTFGNLSIIVFESFDDALAHIRTEVKMNAQA